MSVSKSVFILLLSLASCSLVFSQATPTPFSTFGIGEHYGNALINHQGTAGLGVSQPQFWYANNPNPALLVYNTMTVFQAGIVGERRTVSSSTASETSSGGNLAYLVTAFPLKPTKWSTSLALTPFTNVDYRFQYIDPVIGSNDKVEVTEEGDGGITAFSWSNGVRLAPSLAIGVKASYLFGSITNKYKNILQGSSQPANYAAAIEDGSYVKDFAFSGGISYSLDSIFAKRRYRLSFGATYDFATDLKARRKVMIYRTNSVGDIVEQPDTLVTARGSISMPSGITAGISFSRGTTWAIGTEFSYRDWSDFRSISRDDEHGLKKSWRAALGYELTPDAYASGYFQRVTYRTGISLEEYPFAPNDHSMRDLGINFGLSLPAGRSSLDLAFRFGQRGDKVDNLIEENYFRVFFGITFNDRWFVPRKFD